MGKRVHCDCGQLASHRVVWRQWTPLARYGDWDREYSLALCPGHFQMWRADEAETDYRVDYIEQDLTATEAAALLRKPHGELCRELRQGRYREARRVSGSGWRVPQWSVLPFCQEARA